MRAFWRVAPSRRIDNGGEPEFWFVEAIAPTDAPTTPLYRCLHLHRSQSLAHLCLVRLLAMPQEIVMRWMHVHAPRYKRKTARTEAWQSASTAGGRV